MSSAGFDATKQAHPAEASIRMDIDSNVGNRTDIAQLGAKVVHAVGPEVLRLEHGRPLQFLRAQIPIRILVPKRRLYRHLMRKIAFEVCRVDFDVRDSPTMSKPQNDPVIAWPAAAPRFPSVRHAGGASRQQQIRHRAVVLVTAGYRRATVQSRCQINRLTARGTLPVVLDGSKSAKSCNTSIGKYIELQVRPGCCGRNGEKIALIPIQR